MVQSRYGWRLQLYLFSVLTISAFCRVQLPEAEPTRAEVDTQHQDEGDSGNQGIYRPRPERFDTAAIVTEAFIDCTKKCNYRPFGGNEGNCFGSFVSDCTVTQYFKDDHMLETHTRIYCVGFFKNVTHYGSEEDELETLCNGQFQQVQTVTVYEAVVQIVFGAELVTLKQADRYYSSYSCRYAFSSKRRLKTPSPWGLATVEGSVEVSCDASQNVQIQKGYCQCSAAACSQARENEKTIQFRRVANETGMGNVTAHRFDNTGSPVVNSVDQNFKLLAEHDPELALKVATAIIDEVAMGTTDDATMDDVSPLILEYQASQNVYAQRSYGEVTQRTSHPATSWLHVLCNGSKAAFSDDCDGHFSATVSFATTGNAFLLCKGDWRAYGDVTYVCSGVLTEDESESNDYGSAFSKVSSCTGTVAVSPVSIAMDDGVKFYGLSEICNGEASLRASYSLEDIDHRYMTQTVDPRTVEQMICLLADRTCEQLRFFTTS